MFINKILILKQKKKTKKKKKKNHFPLVGFERTTHFLNDRNDEQMLHLRP